MEKPGKAMDPEHIEDDAVSVSHLPKPGELIRKAREQRSLTNEVLSQRTRLSENVLQLLQSDDFAALGEPVYARGYYRKCAQALGLNGDALVEAYEQHSGTASPVPVIEQRPSIAYREGPGKTALIATLGLMAIVFGLSGLWLWDDEADSQAQRVNPAAAQASELPPADQSPADSTQADTQTAQLAPSAAPVSPTPSAVSTAEGKSSADASEVDSANQPAAVAAAPAATPTPVPTVDPATDAEEATDNDADATTEQPPVAAKALALQVRVAGGDAWVEIYGRTGERLLYKLLHDGDSRTVSGTAPYRLNLGRADNVRLLVNGKTLDFSKQIDAAAKASFWLDADGRVYDDQLGDAG